MATAFYQTHTLSPLALRILPAQTAIFPPFEETCEKIIGWKISYKAWLGNGLVYHITILVESNSSQEKLDGLEI